MVRSKSGINSPVEGQVVEIPVFYRVSYILGGCLGFQPSTVPLKCSVDLLELLLLGWPGYIPEVWVKSEIGGMRLGSSGQSSLIHSF